MTRIVIFLCLLLLNAATTQAQKKSLPVVQVNGQRVQVLDLTGMDRITWGGYEEIGKAVRSESDGAANTKAIVQAVGTNPGYDNAPYAAKICDTLTALGHSDWYLPCLAEMKVIHTNFTTIGLGEKNTYWTSTEVSGTQAAAVYMYTGVVYNESKVNLNHLVCVRRAD